MKGKIIFGIIIPALIVVTLAVLGSLGELKIDRKFVSQLTFQDILRDQSIAESIKIGDLFLENNYFLSKRADLPRLGACLIDKEGDEGGNMQRVDVGQIQYNEGEYTPSESGVQRVLEPYPQGYYGDYYGGGARSVELQPGQKKKITIFLLPSYNFKYSNYGGNMNLSELNKRYGGYDEVLVFESNGQYSCFNVPQETLEKGERIVLVKS